MLRVKPPLVGLGCTHRATRKGFSPSLTECRHPGEVIPRGPKNWRAMVSSAPWLGASTPASGFRGPVSPESECSLRLAERLEVPGAQRPKKRHGPSDWI